MLCCHCCGTDTDQETDMEEWQVAKNYQSSVGEASADMEELHIAKNYQSSVGEASADMEELHIAKNYQSSVGEASDFDDSGGSVSSVALSSCVAEAIVELETVGGNYEEKTTLAGPLEASPHNFDYDVKIFHRPKLSTLDQNVIDELGRHSKGDYEEIAGFYSKTVPIPVTLQSPKTSEDRSSSSGAVPTPQEPIERYEEKLVHIDQQQGQEKVVRVSPSKTGMVEEVPQSSTTHEPQKVANTSDRYEEKTVEVEPVPKPSLPRKLGEEKWVVTIEKMPPKEGEVDKKSAPSEPPETVHHLDRYEEKQVYESIRSQRFAEEKVVVVTPQDAMLQPQTRQDDETTEAGLSREEKVVVVEAEFNAAVRGEQQICDDKVPPRNEEKFILEEEACVAPTREREEKVIVVQDTNFRQETYEEKCVVAANQDVMQPQTRREEKVIVDQGVEPLHRYEEKAVVCGDERIGLPARHKEKMVIDEEIGRPDKVLTQEEKSVLVESFSPKTTEEKVVVISEDYRSEPYEEKTLVVEEVHEKYEEKMVDVVDFEKPSARPIEEEIVSEIESSVLPPRKPKVVQLRPTVAEKGTEVQPSIVSKRINTAAVEAAIEKAKPDVGDAQTSVDMTPVVTKKVMTDTIEVASVENRRVQTFSEALSNEQKPEAIVNRRINTEQVMDHHIRSSTTSSCEFVARRVNTDPVIAQETDKRDEQDGEEEITLACKRVNTNHVIIVSEGQTRVFNDFAKERELDEVKTQVFEETQSTRPKMVSRRVNTENMMSEIAANHPASPRTYSDLCHERNAIANILTFEASDEACSKLNQVIEETQSSSPGMVCRRVNTENLMSETASQRTSSDYCHEKNVIANFFALEISDIEASDEACSILHEVIEETQSTGPEIISRRVNTDR